MNKILTNKTAAGLACLLCLLLTCTACRGQGAKIDYSNSVLAGQITEIKGSQVTLLLGVLTEQEPPMKPEGNGQPPAKPEGGEEPPAKPAGSVMQMRSQGRAQATVISHTAVAAEPTILLLNNEPETQGLYVVGDKPNAFYSFEPGDDSLTLDLAGVDLAAEELLQTRAIAIADLAVGDVLEITVGEQNRPLLAVVKNVAAEAGFGQVNQGAAANLLTEDGSFEGQTYTSGGDDENALRVEGAAVALANVRVQKTGGLSSDTEAGDFYGLNAAALATGGALLTINNAEITSDAPNGNGIFSYGQGTVVSVNKSSIKTLGDNSGGLQTTGGATLNATDVQVSTAGNSSAAIRSDRGGGRVNVIGGQYVSSGYNSPAVYATAAISVSNAALTAENSEALVIEGKNSLKLLDCQVSGNMSATLGASSDENVHNIMIYQSMSGDAEVGAAEFSAQGGSITSRSGDFFYVTNTRCQMTLDGVELIDEAANGRALLRVCGNSGRRGWGQAGANGGQVELLAKRQQLAGDIIVDGISGLDLQLTEGSSFRGRIYSEDEGQGEVNVSVGEGCAWQLTGDCQISSLDNQGKIDFNGHSINLADGKVLRD